MLLSTLFWFSCSTSDNNEESNGKEGDETNVSVYLQQNGFQNLNLVPDQNFVSYNVLLGFASIQSNSFKVFAWTLRIGEHQLLILSVI